MDIGWLEAVGVLRLASVLVEAGAAGIVLVVATSTSVVELVERNVDTGEFVASNPADTDELVTIGASEETEVVVDPPKTLVVELGKKGLSVCVVDTAMDSWLCDAVAVVGLKGFG